MEERIGRESIRAITRKRQSSSGFKKQIVKLDGGYTNCLVRSDPSVSIDL